MPLDFRRLNILAAVVLCLAKLLLWAVPCPAGEPHWKLVWQDEFNNDGRPDPANWDYERGFVRNQELQYYQSENAVCRAGMLIIEGRREKKRNPDYLAGAKGWKNREWIEYTAACLITKGKHEFTYGKFEMRARIDTRAGSWPAFWTLGTSFREIGWPECGEIDIMEYYRETLLFNVCHYILLNQAIGGANGGDPSMTEFPVRLEVDWVRVYQRAIKN